MRTLREVMADPLLHESGLLQEIDHPEYGRLVVARSALRFSGAAAPAYEPSHALGADNAAVFGGELGLTDESWTAAEGGGDLECVPVALVHALATDSACSLSPLAGRGSG